MNQEEELFYTQWTPLEHLFLSFFFFLPSFLSFLSFLLLSFFPQN